MRHVGLCLYFAILDVCSASASEKAEKIDCHRLTEPWQYMQLARTIPLWVTGSPESSLDNAPKALKAGILRFMNEAKLCVFSADRGDKQLDGLDKATAVRMLSFFQSAFSRKEDAKACRLSDGLWTHDTLALLRQLDILLDDNAAATLSAGLASLGLSTPDKLSINLERECSSKEWNHLVRHNAFEFDPRWRVASCDETAFLFDCLLGYLRRLDLASWTCSAWWTREGGVADDLTKSGRDAVKALAAHLSSKGCDTDDIATLARLVDGIQNEPGSAAIAGHMTEHPTALTPEAQKATWGRPGSENAEAGGDRRSKEEPSDDDVFGEVFETTSCVAAMRRGEQQTPKCEKLIRKNNADWWPIDERGNYVDYFDNR